MENKKSDFLPSGFCLDPDDDGNMGCCKHHVIMHALLA